MQLGVGVGVDGDLKQGREDVVQQLLKVVHQALRLVDVVQPRDLHQQTPHHELTYPPRHLH